MKKIVSFALAACMLLSIVPMASATRDYTQGTQVVYTSNGTESYTITVPALLAPGGDGTVTLSGTWAENRVVTVTAEPTVTLKNSIKETDTKTLNVNFDGISEVGSNTGSQTFTESVSVDNITNALFGTWSGKFNYNVEIGNAAITAYSYNGHILPQIPESDEYPYAYMFTIEGEELEALMLTYGYADYIGMVNKVHYVQLSTHPYVAVNEYRFENNEGSGNVKGYIYAPVLSDSWYYDGDTKTGKPESLECKFVWCNTTLINIDSSVHLAASDPVPVYE